MDNQEILLLIDNKDWAAVKKAVAEINTVDIAGIFHTLDDANIIILFRLLPKDGAADVFAYLDPETQEHIVSGLSDKELSAIVNDLFADDAADFIDEMPAGVATRVLKAASEDTRAQINLLLSYGEDTAGSIMTTEFVDLKQSLTIKDAFIALRKKAVDKETIYTCYVKDENRKLTGVVSVRKMLITERSKRISDIMETGVIFARTSDDKETLGQMFTKYGLMSIPVVDSEERLVGIVTVDDALTVIKQEATEDFQIKAATRPSELPYLKTKAFRLALNRVIWLFVLMVAGLLTGGIIESYDKRIGILPILASFIPLLMSTGGNAGSQSSTLITRGLAVGEIKSKDFWRVMWKELRVALIIVPVMALFVFLRVMFTVRPEKLFIESIGLQESNVSLGLAVACSISFTVIAANLIGALLPLAAKKIHVDPAIMASPVLTTILDTCSLLIYFAFLMLFLKGLT